MNQQWILKQMTRDINCLCNKIDQYMEDRQIEQEKECLKYEREQLKCKKEHKKEQLKCKK